MERGQTESSNTFGVVDRVIKASDSRIVLERRIREGDNPVDEIASGEAVSGVPSDTSNPVGIWGAHPPSLNTT